MTQMKVMVFCLFRLFYERNRQWNAWHCDTQIHPSCLASCYAVKIQTCVSSPAHWLRRIHILFHHKVSTISRNQSKWGSRFHNIRCSSGSNGLAKKKKRLKLCVYEKFTLREVFFKPYYILYHDADMKEPSVPVNVICNNWCRKN